MAARALIAALSIVLFLFVSACGGDDDGDAEDQETPTEEAAEPAEPTDGGGTAQSPESAIEQCLADAGQEVVTGNVPVLQGAEAIGIDGGGSLSPGSVRVAIFVYDSEDDAKGAQGTIPAFDEAQEGNVLVVYADPPTPDLQTTVEDCAFGG